MNQPTIVILSTSAPHHPGPVARMLPLARSAAAAGCMVQLLCLDPEWTRHGPQTTHVDGVRIQTVAQMHVRPDGTPYRGLALLWVAIGAIWALTRAALRVHPTVVIIFKAQPMNGIAGQLVALLSRCRVVLDSDDAEAASHRALAGWVHALFDWYERRLPHWVDSVTCATAWQTAQLRRPGVIHIPNGFDRHTLAKPSAAAVAAFRERYQLPAGAVVYVGSLRCSSHAVDLLLDAYARSRRGVPLVIAGSGPDAAALHAQAQQLGIGADVHWLGPIPRSAVPLLWSIALVSVDPVRDDAAAAARFPLKIIESMAHGIPVITSSVGDRADILGLTGYLARAGDAAAYAAMIDLAGTDSPDHTAIQHQISGYDWAQIAPRWYAAHGIMWEAAHV